MMFADPAGRVLGRVREKETWSVRFIDAEIFPDTWMRIASLGADSFEDAVSRRSLLLVRPAWAHSSGCKSRRELVTANEVKRNCMRVTDCGEEAWSEAAG